MRIVQSAQSQDIPGVLIEHRFFENLAQVGDRSNVVLGDDAEKMGGIEKSAKAFEVTEVASRLRSSGFVCPFRRR